jgi:hypothetical protein
VTATLFAASDFHVGRPKNREIVQKMRPECDDDWLLVACDVAETIADIEWALRVLSDGARDHCTEGRA